MTRRLLLGGLAALLLPGIAGAQAPAAPPAMPDAGSGDGQRRRQSVATMSWDQIPPRRQRKLQQRLAGPGNPPLPADQARQMWDGMTPQQRRQAVKRKDGEGGGRGNGRRQQQPGQPAQ